MFQQVNYFSVFLTIVQNHKDYYSLNNTGIDLTKTSLILHSLESKLLPIYW